MCIRDSLPFLKVFLSVHLSISSSGLSQCLAVTGGGSVSECSRLSWNLVRTVIQLYLVTTVLDRLSSTATCKRLSTHHALSYCITQWRWTSKIQRNYSLHFQISGQQRPADWTAQWLTAERYVKMLLIWFCSLSDSWLTHAENSDEHPVTSSSSQGNHQPQQQEVQWLADWCQTWLSIQVN